VRNAFVPDPGNIFMSCDFSGQEMRILAHWSRDPKMVAFYQDPNQKLDIYSMTALEVFSESDFKASGTSKKEFRKMPKSERKHLKVYRDVKSLVLGLGYGLGPASYARGTGKTFKEGKADYNSYYASFPKVKEYQDSQVAFAREHGYSCTLLGRERPLPWINSSDMAGMRAAAERAAYNHPIQGTAADQVKKAAIDVSRLIKKNGWPISIRLIVHDEIIFELPVEFPKQHPEVIQAITDTMCSALPLIVPMESSATYEVRWADERELDDLDDLYDELNAA
jgi:DNA polymerase-1